MLLARAQDFAAKKHTDHRRKGAAKEPYINHLTEVAWRLTEATQGANVVLVAAGMLHDTVEDTETTHDELVAAFGPEIADLVAEVTDDQSLDKDVRKRLQVEETPKKSIDARMLKLADLTSNIRSMKRSPPADWDLERQHAYFTWARDVAAGCRDLNAMLEEGFDRAWEEGTAHLAAKEGAGP